MRNADKQLDNLVKLCRDPVMFARHILHHDLWSTQAQILKAIAVPNSQTR